MTTLQNIKSDEPSHKKDKKMLILQFKNFAKMSAQLAFESEVLSSKILIIFITDTKLVRAFAEF